MTLVLASAIFTSMLTFVTLKLLTPDGKLIGSCKVTGTDGWTEWKQFTCEVSGAAGVHTLYLVFEGDDGFLLNLDAFAFESGLAAGDVNGDGTCNTADLVAVQKHLLTIKALSADQAAIADLNGDNRITAADLSALKRLILTAK